MSVVQSPEEEARQEAGHADGKQQLMVMVEGGVCALSEHEGLNPNKLRESEVTWAQWKDLVVRPR